MTNKRQPISKKTRFDVFKRDGFICQYCGDSPPSVVLEVDHLKPVASMGTNQIDNLITSCFDCNRGKGSRELSQIPANFKEKLDLITEREEQLKEYEKVLRSVRRRKQRSIDQVVEIYSQYYPGYTLSASARRSVGLFLDRLTTSEVIDALEKAISRKPSHHVSFKYFCGICWNIIKAGKDAEPNH